MVPQLGKSLTKPRMRNTHAKIADAVIPMAMTQTTQNTIPFTEKESAMSLGRQNSQSTGSEWAAAIWPLCLITSGQKLTSAIQWFTISSITHVL